ncbi:MAG: AMIN-like domain-containing (lipo)protein [Lysobacter sp.]
MMDIDIRMNALRSGPGDTTALRAVMLVLVLTILGGCRPESASIEATSETAPAPPSDEAVARPEDVASPTPAVVDDGPTPSSGIDLPTPTIAASSADVTSTASEVPILRAVRVGQHVGHDRLVFEFAGEGLPAWRVEYVDQPVTDCGAGNPVTVAGDAWLQIRFSGAHAHTPAGQPTSGSARRKVNQPTLHELVRICDFEAEVTWVAGLSRPTPYTPRALAEPSRLVIDIAH